MSLKDEYEKFVNVAKLILKSNLSRNIDTLNTYRTKIIAANNTIVEYINQHYPNANRTNQIIYDNHLEAVRIKLVNCLNNLQCSHQLGAITEIIDITSIGNPIARANTDSDSDNDNFVEPNEDSELPPHPTGSLNTENQSEQSGPTPPLNPSPPIQPRNPIMGDVNHNFLRVAAGQINKNFSGDPLALASFLDSLDLLQTLATTTELRALLFCFAKTKLEGKARETISDAVTTLDQLKAALRTKIKPENSHVVEGRILSLKFNPSQADEFSNKAEELADALKRTLIIEGVSPEKANQMTIEKTIEVCRRNTTSPLIKSVLEASSFEAPKDVIAKLITQVDKTRAETQILSFQRSNNGTNRGGWKNNMSGRGRGRHNGNHDNQNGYSNNNQYNNNRNFNPNNRGRGRGRGRGQFNNYRGRGAGGYNSYNNYNNQGQNGNNIRVFSQAGNAQGTPAHGQMGPPQDNQISMYHHSM